MTGILNEDSQSFDLTYRLDGGMGFWYHGIFKPLTDVEPRAKLQEECDEFMEAETPEEQLEEAADILLVIGIQLISKGYSLEDLLQEANRKVIVNIQREWEKTPDGTIHHV